MQSHSDKSDNYCADSPHIIVDTSFGVEENGTDSDGGVATPSAAYGSSNERKGTDQEVVAEPQAVSPMIASSVLVSAPVTGAASVATTTQLSDHPKSDSFKAGRATNMAFGPKPFFHRRSVQAIMGFTILAVCSLGLIIPLTRKASPPPSQEASPVVTSARTSVPSSPPSVRPSPIPSELLWEETGSIGHRADGVLGVSLSADGSHLAVGESRREGDSEHPGIVHVYRDSLVQEDKWSNSRTSGASVQIVTTSESASGWEQIGQTLNGSESGYRILYLVSLSGNGTRVAVGAEGRDDESQLATFIAIYEYDDFSWTRLGDPVAVSNSSTVDQIVLSSDGNWLAAAAGIRNRIEVYRYSTGNWRKSDDFPGSTVALSVDNIRVVVAVGDPDANNSHGGVRLYEYSENRNEWNVVGVVSGKSDTKRLGYSLSLSATADRLAVGVPGGIGSDTKQNTGLVRVFEYRKGSWIRIGEDIAGESGDEQFGRSVSLSRHGTRLAVAAHTAGANNIRRVRAYQVDPDGDGHWTRLGNGMEGPAVGDIVSLSAEGDRLIIHSNNVTRASPNSSLVRVFDLRDSVAESPAVATLHGGCSLDQVQFELSLITDLYGQETEWKLLDDRKNTVASGPLGGEFESFKEYQFKRCLDVGCYTFLISDSGNDGICCTYGNGSYFVKVEGSKVASGSNFGMGDETDFGTCPPHALKPDQGDEDGAPFLLPWWLWAALGVLVFVTTSFRRKR